jgi:hypothetical protein
MDNSIERFLIQLLHNLHNFVVSSSAVLIDVGETDMNLTFAVSGLQFAQLPKKRVTSLKKLSAFGHHINLVKASKDLQPIL